MKYQKTMISILRCVIVLAASLALIAAILIVPSAVENTLSVFPDFAYLNVPCQGFFWLSALIFLVALVLAWRITANIAGGESFSMKNAALLMNIARLAFAECVLYFAGAVALYVAGGMSPAILFAAIVMEAIGICATVGCAALSHLTEKAACLQADNDLTI